MWEAHGTTYRLIRDDRCPAHQLIYPLWLKQVGNLVFVTDWDEIGKVTSGKNWLTLADILTDNSPGYGSSRTAVLFPGNTGLISVHGNAYEYLLHCYEGMTIDAAKLQRLTDQLGKTWIGIVRGLVKTPDVLGFRTAKNKTKWLGFVEEVALSASVVFVRVRDGKVEFSL